MTPVRTRRPVQLAIAGVVLAAGVGLAVQTRHEAHELVTNPRATRLVSRETPADRHLPYENASVTTADGLKLVGWFVPSNNGAAIILIHGYKDSRDMLLGLAEVLARHGYGVLIGALRAHDLSDGELITFGVREVQDVDAWVRYLRTRPGVDPSRIGIFGVSMGGAVGIKYAAGHPAINALVADSAFSSVEDTVNTSVRFFTGLPPFPFAPMILFWMEREGGFRAADLDAKALIGRISPRPVMLLQGGADQVISPESGRLLYEAAGEPKVLWFDPAVGHAGFLKAHPEEFERRVSAFYDRYLLHGPE